MLSKKEIAEKVSNREIVSDEEIRSLLISKWTEYQYFGMLAIRESTSSMLSQFTTEVSNLTKSNDELIVSDALECLLEINPSKALEYSLKHIESKSEIVLSSSIYVLGQLKNENVKNIFISLLEKYSDNPSICLACYEALYEKEPKEKYIKKILSYLIPNSHHTIQCSVINILERIDKKKFEDKVVGYLTDYRKKTLPLSVTSTIDDYFAHAQS
jgi:ribosomal protein S17E